MKFVITIYLCLVAASQLGNAQNESTTETTLPLPVDTSTAPETTLPLNETTTAIPSTIPNPITEPNSTLPVAEITSESVPTTEPQATVVQSTTAAPAPSNKSSVRIVEKLSDQIRMVLQHFQEPEPNGFPGQNILTDPMPAPNTTADLGLGTGFFHNITVHGLSNFTVEAVNMLLDEMQVYVMIRMKSVVIKGNCSIETLFTKSKGPFNITLTNVTAEGTVYLTVDSDGKLHANRSSTNMLYQSLVVGSNMNSAFQMVLNGAGVLVLAGIRPYILSHIDQRLNEEVNKQLESSPKIPSIVNMSPVDLAILEGRKYIRKAYEPYDLQNVINHESQYLTVNIGPATIYGLSKFARVGNVTVQMRDGVVQVTVRLITGRLRGVCKWFHDFGKVGLARNGTSLFHVDHVQFEAKVNQSMNLKSTPILDDLQLEVGTIHVKMDGSGNFDYLVEMSVHLIPDMLRHLLIDALEEPIKYKIQSEVLNKINVEKLVEENLSLVEGLLIY